eukprot:scaffold54848_cov46-Attheya_sp.AAC.1
MMTYTRRSLPLAIAVFTSSVTNTSAWVASATAAKSTSTSRSFSSTSTALKMAQEAYDETRGGTHTLADQVARFARAKEEKNQRYLDIA